MADAPNPVDEQIARTAERYDSLPYDSAPIQRTHPGEIGAVAHLCGLEFAPVATARVLELGCAEGGNIIPLAMFYPDARFVGIDLGGRQIAYGKQRAAAAGLDNIELIHGSITDLGPEIGQFDYIICHGVYSWVPDAVRDRIMQICGNHLSPRGVAYISYNVLPGWRLYQTLRDALRVLVPQEMNEVDRAKMAREAIAMMAEVTGEPGAYGQILRATPDRLAPHGDQYLFHEYLEELNEPCTFTDFMASAASHGLSYLNESEIFSVIPQNYSDEFAERMKAMRFRDQVAFGQMMDILTGRTFRMTLLVSSDRARGIDRKLIPERLLPLHLLGSNHIKFEKVEEGIRLIAPNGDANLYRHPTDVRVLEMLFPGRPTSVPMARCLEGASDAEAERIGDLAVNLLVGGMISASCEPLETGDVSEYPVANRMARIDASANCTKTASRPHLGVDMDQMAIFLIRLLDGSRRQADIEDELVRAAEAGLLSFEAGDGGMPSPEQLREGVRAIVSESLESIAAFGVLEP
ncbi:MAG: class I SAM-dependent methyltransferase [Novosphingobium sp.]|nr:class I SAM-dependent methyltransferase [Novosphingobium sp.]